MELSGSASHIASMMYEHTILAAVTETIQEFEAPHGRNELKGICARPSQKTGAAPRHIGDGCDARKQCQRGKTLPPDSPC
jgi:hypothetical protein